MICLGFEYFNQNGKRGGDGTGDYSEREKGGERDLGGRKECLPPAAQLGILYSEKFTSPDGMEGFEADVAVGMGLGVALLRPLRTPKESSCEEC